MKRKKKENKTNEKTTNGKKSRVNLMMKEKDKLTVLLPLPMS